MIINSLRPSLLSGFISSESDPGYSNFTGMFNVFFFLAGFPNVAVAVQRAEHADASPHQKANRPLTQK